MWTISKTYADFFKRCKDERTMILMGGRRSGKTVSTILYLYSLSLLTSGVKYAVLCYQYPQLAKTMADFEKATGRKIKRAKEGFCYRDSNDNLFLFDHCDDTSKALGNDCDFLFINESVNVPEEVADNYILGCSNKVILNFNPIRHSWSDKYANDRNVLKTTFKDNHYLPQSQIDAFERIRMRAESPTATPLDTYNYQVYYLGDYSNATGAIFTDLQTIPYADYLAIPSKEALGMDFGFTNGGDATSVVGVKIHNKTIYAHCYIYDNSLSKLNDLEKALRDAGISNTTTLYADYGGMGKSRIEALIRNYNRSMANAIKPKIIDNIGAILSFEGGLRVTQNSDMMLKELTSYEMINGKLSEKDNHSIDALRYAFNTATRSAL